MRDLIELFTARTPNGIKVPIALEELGAEYRLHKLALDHASLRSPEFLQINPNAKIPALRHRRADGETVTMFESGAILVYLAEQFSGLLGASHATRGNTLSWLFLQVSGLGPAMGNAGHFLSLKSPDPYTLGRFQGEARRQLSLLEERLGDHEWLNGESYSIADIAHFSWVRNARYAGQDIAEFPSLERWRDTIEARPATQSAIARLG